MYEQAVNMRDLQRMDPAMRRILLASTSPYRRNLLLRLGLSFEAVGPDVDE